MRSAALTARQCLAHGPLLDAVAAAGRLEAVQAAKVVLHEIPASDPAAHITSCALYRDHSAWLASASGTQADVFCVTCHASGLLQVSSSLSSSSISTLFGLQRQVGCWTCRCLRCLPWSLSLTIRP